MSLVLRQLRCLLLVIAASLGLSAADGTGTGLLATYYANETLSGSPAVSRTDAQVNFAWSGGAPASGMPVDSFSARWDGEIEARFTENLTLIARTDDGVRLWLDGQLVIDQWVLRSAADSSYTLAAVAGRKYRIRLEYYEHFGSAVAQLLWQSASIPRAAIPSAYLYPTPAFEPSAGTGTGLLARYYANETLSGTPVLARTDARVDFGWGGGSPDGSVPVESFSARWDGEIEARVSEPLTIIARTDDGVRVWINGQVVIDQWVLRSAADSTYTFSAEVGQRYRIRMEYYEHTGAAVARLWWQSANEPKGPIPTSQLYPTDPVDPPNGTGTGLLASYFANETLSGSPVLSRTEARVDHSWGSGSPGAGVPVDVFSARWLGEIEPRVSETLTIIARTDDGVRLWLDGQLVIDQWILRGAADSTYTFSAEAGRRYSIRMEYFEHLGSAVAKLWWQSASEPKAPIPTSQLYPTEPAVPPAGTGTGLFATYFANETLSGDPILSRVEARIDHSWGGGSPGSPVPVDVFSARWEGEIEPRVSEPLTLIARTDDGVRVWLNDTPVIDAWILRGAADSTYTFTAVAGQRYRIRMEYFEHYGSAVAKLWWQSANEPKGPIPTSQLYPITGTPTTPTIAFANPGTSVAETVGSTPVAVTLSQPAATAVTVTIQSSGSGATAPATVTIPAGGTTASVPVAISDDPRFGPDRQVTLSLVNPVGADLGLVTSHVLTIQNTDAAPTIAFTVPTSFNLEQSGTASVIVRLSAVSAQTTTVTVGLTGTAEAGSDYQAPSATLQIPADTFEGTIFIPLLADSTPEQDETIIVTLSAPVGATLSNPSVHTITLSDGNLAPVIANGPTPAVNPVTGTSVSLSFVATDDGGAANLSFTWSTVGSVPAPVSFAPATGSVGTSSTTTATFTAPGTYPIQILVRDAYDLTATAQTTITVQSTPALITVAPATATVSVLGTQSFTATGVNQFGAALAQPLSVTWSVAGGGAIDANGVFTAGTTAGGPFTVSATLPTAQGVAAVTVIDNAPTVVQGPTATVNAAGTGLILSALAADDGGETALTYRWSVEGSAPGIVSFAANDSNAAKSTTATVSAAGTYTLRLTVTDAAGQATPVTTPVTVAQQLTALAIAPDTVSLTTGAEFDFTLTGRDQFDAVMASIPSPMWSITGGGTITPTATGAHLVVGNEAGGPFTITAASGAIQATATVTIVPPTGQAQTITFAALPAKTYGDAAFALTATATSGLPVSFSSSDTSVATISGTTVTIVGAGTTNITAAQDGDATWDPAAPVVQPLTVGKAAQTITFAALTARTVADEPFVLTATASSGLPVSYASSHPDVATIVGDQVTIVAAGTTTITAIQTGGANHLPAESVPQVLTVSKVAQAITFAALSAKTYGDAPFAIAATASSGLPVELASSDTSVATIQDGTVTIHAAGTTIITATQPGDATWDAATPVPQTLTVNKAPQTITFGALSSYTVGDLPFTLSATASSGLSVTFTSSTPAVASVSGDTVTIVAAGTTTISAEQAGNGNYLAAEPVAQPLTIAPPPKQTQTINFAELPGKTYGDAPFDLAATASSGLPVSYTSSDTSVATINGNTVNIVGAGSTSIMASQTGDATWEAATSVVQLLTVAKASQTITFAALTARAVGDGPFTLGATASSGLPVVYTSSDMNVATVSGNTVTIVGAGTTTITASQGGNANYLAAPDVQRTQTIEPAAKQPQTITFASLPGKTYGDPAFAIQATASSGLPVAFISSNTAVATISGGQVTIINAGMTTITAEQAGDETYAAATPVPQLLVVGRASQTITFGELEDKVYTDAPFALTATASSGLPITYTSSDTYVASVNDGIVTLHAGGTTTITAYQIGDENWLAAASVSQIQEVGWYPKEPQTIYYFETIPPKTYGDAPFALAAYATSSLPVEFISSDPTILSITDNTATILGAGSVTITASQEGDIYYLAAPLVTQEVTIAKGNQIITFAPLATRVLGSVPFILTATTSSGLPIIYTSSDPGVASVNGSEVTLHALGSTLITANQAGDINWLPATLGRNLTVAASNNPPTISTITAKSTLEDVRTATIAFTVSDSETSVGDLTMTGNSNNPALVDASSIEFFGTTGSRSLTIRPKANQYGVATVSVTVTDNWAPAGTATTTFILTVNSQNDAPTLTSVTPLQGGDPGVPVVITYAELAAAANEDDVDGDVVNFRIENYVAFGSVGVRPAGSTADTTPVVPGSTIFDVTKELVWTPPSDPSQQMTAFWISAFDGTWLSSAVSVQIRLTDSPILGPTVPFTDVTTTEAMSGGVILSDNGSDVTARGVCWASTPNATTANSKTVDGSGLGAFSSHITGLVPAQVYYVRSYATSAAGTSYGTELVLTATPYTFPNIGTTFSPSPGSYFGPLSVTMTPPSAGMEIWYTTGEFTPVDPIPGVNSTLYAAPVPLSGNVTIKAVARTVVSGTTQVGPVVTARYTILHEDQYAVSEGGGNSSPSSPTSIEIAGPTEGLAISATVVTNGEVVSTASVHVTGANNAYAEASLSPAQTSTVTFSLKDKAGNERIKTKTMTWSAIDLSTGVDDVVIRAGDSVQFTAVGDGPISIDPGNLIAGAQALTISSGGGIRVTYDAPGTYEATSWTADAELGSATIHVVQFSFPPAEVIAAEVDVTRSYNVPIAPDGSSNYVHFASADPTVLQVGATKTYTLASLTLRPLKRGKPVVLARLGNDTGAILSYKEVSEFEFQLVYMDFTSGDDNPSTRNVPYALCMRPYIPGLTNEDSSLWNPHVVYDDQSGEHVAIDSDSLLVESSEVPDPIWVAHPYLTQLQPDGSAVKARVTSEDDIAAANCYRITAHIGTDSSTEVVSGRRVDGNGDGQEDLTTPVVPLSTSVVPVNPLISSRVYFSRPPSSGEYSEKLPLAYGPSGGNHVRVGPFYIPVGQSALTYSGAPAFSIGGYVSIAWKFGFWGEMETSFTKRYDLYEPPPPNPCSEASNPFECERKRRPKSLTATCGTAIMSLPSGSTQNRPQMTVTVGPSGFAEVHFQLSGGVNPRSWTQRYLPGDYTISADIWLDPQDTRSTGGDLHVQGVSLSLTPSRLGIGSWSTLNDYWYQGDSPQGVPQFLAFGGNIPIYLRAVGGTSNVSITIERSNKSCNLAAGGQLLFGENDTTTMRQAGQLDPLAIVDESFMEVWDHYQVTPVPGNKNADCYFTFIVNGHESSRLHYVPLGAPSGYGSPLARFDGTTIDIGNGVAQLEEKNRLLVDIPIKSFGTPSLDPNLRLYYNVRNAFDRGFGPGWQTNFDMWVYGSLTNGSVRQLAPNDNLWGDFGSHDAALIDEDGKAIQFYGSTSSDVAGSHGRFVADVPGRGRYVLDARFGSKLPTTGQWLDGERWRLTKSDNRVYYFRTDGGLVRITNVTDDDDTITLTRLTSGRLVTVSDSHDRSLDIQDLIGSGSEANQLTGINAPAGGKWTFTYDDNLLKTMSIEGTARTRHGAFSLEGGGNARTWTFQIDEGLKTTEVSYGVIGGQERKLTIGATTTYPMGGQQTFTTENGVAVRIDQAGIRHYSKSVTVDGRNAMEYWIAASDNHPQKYQRTQVFLDGSGRIDGIRRYLTANEYHQTDMAAGPLFKNDKVIEGTWALRSVIERDVTGLEAGSRGDLVTTYNYETEGRKLGKVRSINTPSGTSSIFAYHDDGRIHKHKDPRGKEWTYPAHNSLGQPTSVLSPRLETSSSTFDTDTGAAMSGTDQWDYTSSVIRDEMGRVINGTAPGNIPVETDYDPLGAITRTKDELGRETKYTYDGLGRLTRIHRIASGNDTGVVTSALDDETIVYTPEAGGRLLVTHKRGTTLILSKTRYDALGRVVDEIAMRTLVATDPEAPANPQAQECTVHYHYLPVSGFLETRTDERGFATTFTYDDAGRNLTVETPEHNLATTTYNGLGWILSRTDGNNLKSTFTYDANGQMRRITNPAGGWTLVGYNQAGGVASNEGSLGKPLITLYDDDGVVRGQRDRFDTQTSVTREKVAGVVTETVMRLGDDARRKRFFDNRGLINGSQTMLGSVGFDSAVTLRNDGSLRRQTPAGFGEIESLIDGFGRPAIAKRTLRVDGADTLVDSTIEHQAGSGLPLASRSTLGLYSKAEPDPATGERNGHQDNVAAPQVNPSALQTDAVILKRDASGNVLLSGQYAGTEGSGGPSLLTRRTYDKDHRPKTVRGPAQVVTEWFYDIGGRVESLKRGGFEIAHYDYDVLGNVIKTTRPGNQVTQASYNNVGLKLTDTAGGLTTMYEYDPDTLFLTRIIAPGGKIVERVPDARGRLFSERVLPQLPMQYEYDDLDRVELITFPDGKTEHRTYITDTQAVDVVTDRQLRTIKHVYDPSGLLIEKIVTENAVPTTVKVARSLPAGGGMVQQSHVESGSTVGEPMVSRMDRAGRPVAFEQPDNAPVGTSYDTAGRLATKGDRTFQYNALGQLEHIQQAGAGQVTFGYDALGRVQSQQLPNGLERTYSYNAIGNLNSLTQSIDDIDQTWTIQRDQQARVAHLDGPGYGLDFGYDELGRLQRAVRTGDLPSSTYYAYDSSDNRTWSVTYPQTEPQVQEFTAPTIPSQIAPQVGTWSIVDGTLSGTGASAVRANLSLAATLAGAAGTCVPEMAVQVAPQVPAQVGDATFSGFQMNGAEISYRAEWMVNRPEVPGEFEPPAVGRLVIRRVDANGMTTIAAGNSWPVASSKTLTLIVWPDERVSVSTAVTGGTDTITGYCPGVGTNLGNLLPTVALVASANDGNGVSLPASVAFDQLCWAIAANLQRTGATYNQFNQLTAEVHSGQQVAQVQYTYDDLGRLTERTRTGNGAGVVAYGYDALDRLTSATIDTVPVAYTYVADTWMRRTSISAFQNMSWAYDGTDMISMKVGTTATTRYLSHAGKPLWEVDSQGLRSYGHDPLGNVTGLVGPLTNGTVTMNGYQRAYTYDAFGSTIREELGQLDQNNLPELTSISAAPLSGVRGKGMWYDAQLGAYKTQTRFYAPEIARFTQVDPARAGRNWYAYCGGDPVNRSDPSGLDWVWSDADSAWKWVANATDPNKGELQDIPIPEWAVPGFNWTYGPKTISTEHALVTRLAPNDDMRSPAILAMAQLVGSGIAGWSTQAGKWDQETHEMLFSYFKENKISSGTVGIDTYNKWADSERARIDALVEAKRRTGAQFDEAKFREGMYKTAKIGLGMVPVIAALDATVKAQGGDYKGAAESAAGLLPIEKVIITVGTVAVVGTTIVLTANRLKRIDVPEKPRLTVNEERIPGPNFKRGKTSQPDDAEDVYKNAVPDEQGRHWYGVNSKGDVYLFNNSNNGTVHFSGSKSSDRGLLVPHYVQARLEEVKKKLGIK